MDQLLTTLLDFLHELQGRNIPIMVGGGFGLYLRRRHLDVSGERTLLRRLPEPRSTNDLDLFLRTEILVDLERTRQVADAILRLGFTVVAEARFLQWERELVIAGSPYRVKIDMLVGPLGEDRQRLNVKMPRVRPKGDIEFHAHAVEEAIRIEQEALTITVSGNRSTGESYSAEVLIPHAFPYLMMKLHAFDDRRLKGELEKEQQHALDLYTIVGTMTEEEYDRAKALGISYAQNQHVSRARTIVRERFGSRTAIGTLRLREHRLFREDFEIDAFLATLAEIFDDK